MPIALPPPHLNIHVVIISFRKGIEVNERGLEEHFSQIKDNNPHPSIEPCENELKLLKGLKVNPKFINFHNPT